MSIQKFERLCIATALAMGLSGCAVVQSDLKHSGGLVGDLGNSVIVATNDHMQLYRATFAFAFLSRMGSVTIGDASSARSFYWNMAAVRDDLNRMGGHLDTNNPDCIKVQVAYQDCKQLFESELPSVETHLFLMAAGSLPMGQFRQIGDDLMSGSYWGALFKVATVSGQEIYALHGGAAVYRSETEMFAMLLKAGAANDTTPPVVNMETATEVIDSYKDRYAKGNLSIPDTDTDGAIKAMFNIIQDSCTKIAAKANADPTTPGQIPSCDMKFDPKPNSYAPKSSNNSTGQNGDHT